MNDAAQGAFGTYSTNYTRDANGNLTAESRSGLFPCAKTYQYDGLNNRTQKVENAVATNYSYNGLCPVFGSSAVENIAELADDNVIFIRVPSGESSKAYATKLQQESFSVEGGPDGFARIVKKQ
ncbi:MAG: hypothetical protein Kow00107_02260 [Planctomycetota bacterium]